MKSIQIGVDTVAGKNLVGAFHPPSAVIIDPEALRKVLIHPPVGGPIPLEQIVDVGRDQAATQQALAALPSGQYEAADSLGLDYWKSMRLIILPQAFRKMTPLLLQQSIILFQDTSLVYTVGLVDFLNASRANGDIIGRSNEFLIIAGLVYFTISFAASLLVKRLQKRFAV